MDIWQLAMRFNYFHQIQKTNISFTLPWKYSSQVTNFDRLSKNLTWRFARNILFFKPISKSINITAITILSIIIWETKICPIGENLSVSLFSRWGFASFPSLKKQAAGRRRNRFRFGPVAAAGLWATNHDSQRVTAATHTHPRTHTTHTQTPTDTHNTHTHTKAWGHHQCVYQISDIIKQQLFQTDENENMFCWFIYTFSLFFCLLCSIIRPSWNLYSLSKLCILWTPLNAPNGAHFLHQISFYSFLSFAKYS